jgi:archaemetzincin
MNLCGKVALASVAISCALVASCAPTGTIEPAQQYAYIESKLKHLAIPLAEPGPNDWLSKYSEPGQTFEQYLSVQPNRKGLSGDTIYILLLGDFAAEQNQILETTEQYLEIFFQVPVKMHRRMALAELPERARRPNTRYGEQILTTYILDEILLPDRPKNALAYVAFTASDLFPSLERNFVFGQASLENCTGVWSIARFCDPAESKAAYQLCLRRMLHTASHEVGHILGIRHCTAFDCNMNGANSLAENDRKPMTMCPVCLRKICWNLQVDPRSYLSQLETFCGEHELKDEAVWYKRAIEALAKD